MTQTDDIFIEIETDIKILNMVFHNAKPFVLKEQSLISGGDENHLKQLYQESVKLQTTPSMGLLSKPGRSESYTLMEEDNSIRGW